MHEKRFMIGMAREKMKSKLGIITPVVSGESKENY